MGLTRPSFGQQGCCGSPFPPAEWRLGTGTLGNWYKWQFRGKSYQFDSPPGWSLQELARVVAHCAQLRQGGGVQKKGGWQEGRLFQGPQVGELLYDRGVIYETNTKANKKVQWKQQQLICASNHITTTTATNDYSLQRASSSNSTSIYRFLRFPDDYSVPHFFLLKSCLCSSPSLRASPESKWERRPSTLTFFFCFCTLTLCFCFLKIDKCIILINTTFQVQMVALPPSIASTPPAPGSRQTLEVVQASFTYCVFQVQIYQSSPCTSPNTSYTTKSFFRMDRPGSTTILYIFNRWRVESKLLLQVDDFLSRPSKSPPSRSSTPRKRSNIPHISPAVHPFHFKEEIDEGRGI